MSMLTFYSRPPLLKVKNTKPVHDEFNKQPVGLTPIVPALRSILQARRLDNLADKDVLILIATDG